MAADSRLLTQQPGATTFVVNRSNRNDRQLGGVSRTMAADSRLLAQQPGFGDSHRQLQNEPYMISSWESMCSEFSPLDSEHMESQAAKLAGASIKKPH